MALTEIPIELSSTPSIVDGGNATAITIDSSENVLVGKTSSALANEGVVFEKGGAAEFTTDAARVMRLNRTSSDGSVLEINKDGTTVGSIGTTGSNLVIGTGDTGFRFFDGSPKGIFPASTSTGVTDGAIDLGKANGRFKDLYLSGGAYLGGTAAANKLEDYEEGTWTPTFSVTSGAVEIFSARYTKIGRQVIINLSMNVTSTVSSGEGALVFTVPFTQFTQGTTDIGLCSVYPDGLNSNSGLVVNNSSGNNTQFAMVFTLVASYGAGSAIIAKLVYETNQ